jgi:uncharacterized protein (TIGR00661 family)
MRILYGVCGEGFGHSTRSKEIIIYLISKGHKVKVICYNNSYYFLSRYFDTIKLNGFKNFYNNSERSIFKSIVFNFPILFKNLKDFFKIDSKIKKFKPEVCISDLEPITTFFSYFYNLPLISIDNQHYVNFNIQLKDYPRNKIKSLIFEKMISRLSTAGSNYYIILSFEKHKDKKNVFYVDPIIRKEIIDLNSTYENFHVVYLKEKNNHLLNILKNISSNFVVFGYNIEKKESNLLFKKFDSLPEYLARCSSIIGTGGFSLISEAIYLNKPYFVLPLSSEIEQYINARIITKLGYGNYSLNLKRYQLEDFLKKNKVYIKNLLNKKYSFNNLFEVLQYILKDLNRKNSVSNFVLF